MSKKPPILCRKDNGRLVPVDAWSAEQMDALPTDKTLSVTVTHPRSLGRLGWWWGGLALAVDNFSDEDRERWPTSRKLHNAILEALGFTEKLWRVDGTYRIEVDSISFDAMTEEEFKDVFALAEQLAIKLWDYSPWAVWMEQRKP